MKKNTYFEHIKGKKVRAQYFSHAVIFMFTACFTVFSVLSIIYLYDGIPTTEFYDTCLSLGIVLGPVLLFFLIFWLLVHFRLGFVVCILDSEGIHYDGGMIPWDKIQKIVYHISVPDRSQIVDDNPKCCTAIIFTENEEVKLEHAPLFLLRLAKKAHPEIKTGFSRLSKGLILGFILILLIFILVFAIAPLFLS